MESGWYPAPDGLPGQQRWWDASTSTWGILRGAETPPGITDPKARKAFLEGPVGRAQSAFRRGDLVFQCEIDVMNQQAIIVGLVGSATAQSTTDSAEVLNAVCREGWNLISGSFVFVTQGQQSRDKLLSSGQNVAVRGKTVGYYLFNRGTPSPAGQVD